ncbi:PAS domain S-box protein [Flavobacteriaceae bacterium]|nr:PAS domain S-box protein [Flavobacteriaceae bacterium]MDB4325064.1 PAS domain S-box protein [Flavobacteriaceae bacterium]
MLSKKIEILTRALQRERKAKEIAEGIIENRLRELYDSNQSLTQDIIQKEEFQKNLIDNLVDALIVFDFDMNILKINKEALKLLGFDKKNAPKNIKEFKPKYRKKLQKHFSTATLGKGVNSNEFLFDFINRNRKLKHVHIKASVLKNSKHEPYAYQTIIRDITKEHLTEQKLKEQQKVIVTESLILKNLLDNPNVFENGNNIVSIIADYLGTEDCVFYAIIENKIIQVAAINQKLDSENNIKNALQINLGEGIVGKVAQSKKGIIVNNTSKHKDYIVDDQIRLSEITVPILLDNELIAIIDAEHPDKNFFKKTHLEFLSQISSLISVTLKKNIVELEKSNKEIELDITRNRLQLIFESSSDAKAIESIDGYIEQVSHAFLGLFKIPVSEMSNIVGTDCQSARNMLKTMFVEENIFSKRIEEIVKEGTTVIDEMLELKDGRILSRDYNPIFKDGKPTAHLWTYKDVTLIVNYDKSLQFESKKYKSIIENMNLGLMEVDNNEIILNVNNAFSNMCGYSPEELVGFKARDILLDDKKQEYMQQKVISRQEGVKDLYEMEILTKTGETKYWLISGGPNTNINGEIIGSIGIHLDITELKMLNIKADSLINDLTVRNEELSHYAHIVSHDLKTPLRTISTCLNWLLEDNTDTLDKESKGYIDTVEEAINDMDKLISSTLQYTEIRTSRKVAAEQLPLQTVVDSIISFLTKNKKSDFNFNVVKPLPVINLTEVKARQVFQNLIENAYKYRDETKNSFVNIDWKEDNGFYQFSIQDNGIGIGQEHFDLVFEAFKKLNNRTDSSGIGLFIIKKVITSGGGKIWVESEKGVGTTFFFTIPK